VPAPLFAEMEVEPASKGEEQREEEGTGPAAVKEEGPQLENGEGPEENEESAGTDSGQELSTEARSLRSGTYGDRTESKAYGSIIHKCEVRGAGGASPLPAQSQQSLTHPFPAVPTGLWEGVHAHGELQAAHPNPHG
jgi:hypothetical protein